MTRCASTLDESRLTIRSELSDNQLSGPLPPTLIALGSLKTVYLRNNSLTGQLAFTGGALSTLIVSRNQFWSMDLSANTELTRVSVRRTAGGDLRSPRSQLDDNPISGWLPPAANVSQLRVFTAARCNFTGPAFNLTELPNLTRLCVRSTPRRPLTTAAISNAIS